MYILGIETSCDETAAAVVQNGTDILSSIVSSQVAVHHRYGGVVPELASRKHVEAIVPVVAEAVSASGLKTDQIDAIAVTRGPGLVGALLVGFAFAKACAYALGIPLVGVNRLEGHINSVFLETESPPFPFVALLASGGHTAIYYVTSHTTIENMGQTRDDAAGEAFDKVAKILSLGYPGGPIISKWAKRGNAQAIDFPRPLVNKPNFDFSFSGLKTAVLYEAKKNSAKLNNKKYIADVCASFQEAAVDTLVAKTIRAAEKYKVKSIMLAGGVSANEWLRQEMKIAAKKYLPKVNIVVPELKYTGDNAAMESFFALLQKNVLNQRRWTTRQELRIAIVTWIERTYHRRRRQRRLGRLTPIEYETIMTPSTALAA